MLLTVLDKYVCLVCLSAGCIIAGRLSYLSLPMYTGIDIPNSNSHETSTSASNGLELVMPIPRVHATKNERSEKKNTIPKSKPIKIIKAGNKGKNNYKIQYHAVKAMT